MQGSQQESPGSALGSCIKIHSGNGGEVLHPFVQEPQILLVVPMLSSWKTSVQALDEDQQAWFRVVQTQAGALRCGNAPVKCPELPLQIPHPRQHQDFFAASRDSP